MSPVACVVLGAMCAVCGAHCATWVGEDGRGNWEYWQGDALSNKGLDSGRPMRDNWQVINAVVGSFLLLPLDKEREWQC